MCVLVLDISSLLSLQVKGQAQGSFPKFAFVNIVGQQSHIKQAEIKQFAFNLQHICLVSRLNPEICLTLKGRRPR